MGLKYGLGPYWIVVEVLAVDLRGRLRVNLDSWFYITVFQQISFNYNIFSWLFFNVFFRSFSNRFYSSFSTFFNSDYYVVSRLIFKLIQSFLADNNFLPIILYDFFFFESSSIQVQNQKSAVFNFQFWYLVLSQNSFDVRWNHYILKLFQNWITYALLCQAGSALKNTALHLSAVELSTTECA